MKQTARTSRTIFSITYTIVLESNITEIDVCQHSRNQKMFLGKKGKLKNLDLFQMNDLFLCADFFSLDIQVFNCFSSYMELLDIISQICIISEH